MLTILLLMASVAYAGAQESSIDLQTVSPGRFFVPKGTPVKLRVVEPISSETANVGDRVTFEVIEDVKVDDVLVIPKGSKGEGFVSEARPGRIWGAGRLGIYVSSVRTRTGVNLPVYTVLEAIGSPSGASVGAVISEGTSIVAATELDVPLDKTLYAETSYAAQRGQQ